MSPVELLNKLDEYIDRNGEWNSRGEAEGVVAPVLAELEALRRRVERAEGAIAAALLAVPEAIEELEASSAPDTITAYNWGYVHGCRVAHRIYSMTEASAPDAPAQK